LRTQKPRLEIERAQHSVRWQPNAGPKYDAASPSKQGKSCSKATVRLGPRLSHGVVAAAPPPSLPLASSAAPARLLLRPRRRRRGRRRRLEAQRHRRRRRCSPRPGPPTPFRGPPQLTGTSYRLAFVFPFPCSFGAQPTGFSLTSAREASNPVETAFT
jgi:hypothetical protein